MKDIGLSVLAAAGWVLAAAYLINYLTTHTS